MDEKSLAMSCLCPDVLNALGHSAPPQDQRSDAEVITPGLVAMRCLRGHFDAARTLRSLPPFRPQRLSRRRVNRGWPRLKPWLLTLFAR
jgi:hypothetical protein